VREIIRLEETLLRACYEIEKKAQRGGVARVNLITGEAALIGNVVDPVEAPPIITKAGVLLVASKRYGGN
jgi:hypothetical protein